MKKTDPRNGMQVCVSRCPNDDLTTEKDVKDFAINENSRLCRYDIDPNDYEDPGLYSDFGPCPKLRVFKRQVFIGYCCELDIR